jgi:hypothetical protein
LLFHSESIVTSHVKVTRTLKSQTLDNNLTLLKRANAKGLLNIICESTTPSRCKTILRTLYGIRHCHAHNIRTQEPKVRFFYAPADSVVRYGCTRALPAQRLRLFKAIFEKRIKGKEKLKGVYVHLLRTTRFTINVKNVNAPWTLKAL